MSTPSPLRSRSFSAPGGPRHSLAAASAHRLASSARFAPAADNTRAYLACAVALGVAYLVASLGFLRARSDRAARRLFWVSLVHLPVLLAALAAAARS